jgi:transketolase
VAECLSTNFPCPIEFVGVKDCFGQSGKPEELYDNYGLNEKTIAQSVERIFLRK